MGELTPEKLGEMTGGKAPESLFRRPERKVVTDTVTAVGSPLTDPEGVEKGRYSYSETTGGDQNDWWSQSWWTPERIADQQKRFTLLSTDPRHPMMTGEPIWRERTVEQWAQYVKEAKEARGLIQPEKKKGLFSRIRKSGDSILTISTSDLMAMKMRGESVEPFVRNIYAARWALENGITPETMSSLDEKVGEFDMRDKDKDPSEPPMKATWRPPKDLNVYDPAISWAIRRIDSNPKEFGVKKGDEGYVEAIKKLAKTYKPSQKQLQYVYQRY